MNLLLDIHIAFIESHHHRDSKLKKLGGKEKPAAKIRGIYYVDDRIRLGSAHIFARNALFWRERAHRISPWKVYG